MIRSRWPARRRRLTWSFREAGTRLRPWSGWPESSDCPWRSEAGSVFGFVFADGVVLDMNRMKDIEIDAGNWCASRARPCSNFRKRRSAGASGSMSAAEPAATVCGNIVCTGTFSTWSERLGTAADGFVDMEFVDRKGNVFRAETSPRRTSSPSSTPSSRPRDLHEGRGLRLHPVTDDEEGRPRSFRGPGAAVRLAGELGRRRIGLAVAVLGRHYIANFLSPSEALAERLKEELPRVLGMEYAVSGTPMPGIRSGRWPERVIDAGLLKTLTLGLPRLLNPEWLVVRGLEGGTPPSNSSRGQTCAPCSRRPTHPPKPAPWTRTCRRRMPVSLMPGPKWRTWSG